MRPKCILKDFKILKIDISEVAKLPSKFGNFYIQAFKEGEKEHLVIKTADISCETPIVRVHSECLTGDALFSLRCDCGFQLQAAMQRIAEEKRGVLLYVRQEGRGIGLLNKIHAYQLQDQGADTVDANVALGFAADMRDYTICADMLKLLGVQQLRLMTNNPRKLNAMEKMGIHIAERVPLQEGKNPYNEFYLATKAGKLGHLLQSNPGDSSQD